VAPGERVLVGAPIARVDLGGAEDWTGGDQADEAPEVAEAAKTTAAVPVLEAAVAEVMPAATPAGPVRATPPARRAARMASLDLASLSGTGRRGRVELRDVEGAGALAADGEGEAGGIAFAASGPGTGVPVLLLHGFAGDRATWAVLAASLARAGMRVMAADLPAHGRTKVEAEDAVALGQGLAPLAQAAGGRPHLVAHSLGAAAALALAAKGRAASVTLIAPAGMGLSIDREFIQGMADPRTAGEVAHLLRRLSDRPLSLSVAAIEQLHASLAKGRLKALAGSILGPLGQALDLVPAVEAVSRTMPVRVLVGHQDRIMDWRDALRLPSRVAVHHFPSAGHMPHWDAPAEVHDILVRAFA
jgi:pyruvate dehydrogenase E2 component (dihydrolipoamide acetyltransferase)